MTCCRCAVPEMRQLVFDLKSVMMRGRTEDSKGVCTIARIHGTCTSASNMPIPSTSLCGRKLSLLRYDRAKNIDRRSLLSSTTMITSPDQNRHHRIVSALSLSPAAVGKPSFACFSAAIVTGRLCRPHLSTGITHRSNNARRIGRACT